MTDAELSNKIAALLLAVEQVPGVKLLQSKLAVQDESGQVVALVSFNPDTWRQCGEPLQVMVERITADRVQPARHYKVK